MENCKRRDVLVSGLRSPLSVVAPHTGGCYGYGVVFRDTLEPYEMTWLMEWPGDLLIAPCSTDTEHLHSYARSNW